MDRADRAARDTILQRVFPDLRYGEDPDIDRYFELRRTGRIGDALNIYNRGLRTRYPDDSKRIVLMNLYRRRDPRFSDFHDVLLWELYESIAERLKRNLDSICDPLTGVSLKNTYKVLKTLEFIVSFLPGESEAALNLLDLYAFYAETLGYRPAETRKIRFLAGEYFAQATDQAPEETDLLARSQASQEREEKKKKDQERQSFFNLSKISFSAEDLERIDIPKALERKEDQVLAFCFKYWRAVEDASFERIVFLYSRKYGTPHYEVFRAVKLGRARKFTDDEILNRVSTALSSRYSYSVQGDLYMQRSWRLLKARLMGAQALPTPAPSLPAKSPPIRRPKHPKAKKGGRGRKDYGPREEDGKLRRRPAGTRGRGLAPLRRPEAVPVLNAKGSVSDRIKRLSGRSYDVYKQEFLAKVRPSVHSWLLGRRTQRKGAFEDSINKAEDIVWEFLEKNYSNPFMDWESSEARKRVEALGFSAPSLDEVIVRWYEKL